MQTYTDDMVLEATKQNISNFERLVRKFEAAGQPWTARFCRDWAEELRAFAAEMERRGCIAKVERPPLRLVR